MLFVVFVSAVLALSAPTVQGQVYGWGRCPKVTGAENFHQDHFPGPWVEIARFPNSDEVDLHCVRDMNTIQEDGTFNVKSVGVRDGLAVDLESLSGVVNPEEPSKILVPFYGSNYLPVWVLEIDDDPQTGYYVVYSCYDIWVGNMQHLWIMSKQRQMDKGRLNGILGRLEEHDIDTSKIEYVRQDDTCPPALP